MRHTDREHNVNIQTPEGNQPSAVGQIIEMALGLDPRRALRYTNGDQARLCMTAVITSLHDDSGQIAPLEKVGTKYGALYARVSTPGQAEDGYSTEDQVRRGVEYFLRYRQAFRVFSDASLSGGLPIYEPNLIRKLAINKATRCEKVFTSIFFYEHSRFNEEQRAGLQGYLSNR